MDLNLHANSSHDSYLSKFTIQIQLFEKNDSNHLTEKYHSKIQSKNILISMQKMNSMISSMHDQKACRTYLSRKNN